jgi:DNA-binding protein YbaB
MVQFSRTVDVTLDDGETERFVVQTLGDDAVKIELSGTSSPYDIDIQTSSEHPAQSPNLTLLTTQAHSQWALRHMKTQTLM